MKRATGREAHRDLFREHGTPRQPCRDIAGRADSPEDGPSSHGHANARCGSSVQHLVAYCYRRDIAAAVEAVFDRCKDYGWEFIITMKEGRQPTAFDEAIQIMLMNPSRLWKGERMGEDGRVEQTARWSEQVPVSGHLLNVLFLGEIAPHAATLWAWVTHLRLDTDRIAVVVNHGGRARFLQEENFNVLKNNGYGLEHAFCTPEKASKNYHIMLLVADIIWQILADGVLARLKHLARKLTDTGFVRLMFAALIYVPISSDPPRIGQIRFRAPG